MPKSLRIALPKGRLGEKVLERFEQAGYSCPEMHIPSRKLIYENKELNISYFWAKPIDVPIYVERGAADIGVAGKDILNEYQPDTYELADLGLGQCAMCVAAPKNYRDHPERRLIVATKFPHIAARYYFDKGREIDIIHLNGSIEIAPVIGLADVIVDIVETGLTLKENDLIILDTIQKISARLIANQTSYAFKTDLIQTLLQKIKEIPS